MKSHQYKPSGRYFEDFTVGDTMVSPGRTVTETDLLLFSGLSGDFNELHTNAEYAKGTVFGQRVAHGPLGIVMAVGLAGRLGYMEGTAQAWLGLEWKFKNPIFIGDTIRVTATVQRTREVKRLQGGVIVLEVAILNQRDEVVQQGTWTVLMKSRPEE
jgi:3-hydroxybutyryl-CoA dehydratase